MLGPNHDAPSTEWLFSWKYFSEYRFFPLREPVVCYETYPEKKNLPYVDFKVSFYIKIPQNNCWKLLKPNAICVNLPEIDWEH